MSVGSIADPIPGSVRPIANSDAIFVIQKQDGRGKEYYRSRQTNYDCYRIS